MFSKKKAKKPSFTERVKEGFYFKGKEALFKAKQALEGVFFLAGKMEFKELTERITPKLKAITMKLDGKYTLFNDEDLYQEGLLHLWNKYGKKELCDKTDSFILQSCYFFLRNYIRKVYKGVERNSISLDANTNGEDNTFANILSLDHSRHNAGDGKGYLCPLGLEKRETQADSVEADLLLEDIRKMLTERENEVLSLSLESLTTREMGKILGISHVMVVKIKKRIRDKIKKDQIWN